VLLPDAGSTPVVPDGVGGGGATPSASTGDSLESTPAERGDAHASVEVLFREHWDELCLLAGGIVGFSDAEDVVMNVVTAVLERASDDRSVLTSSYLFGAVRQEARKVTRRAARQERLTAWSDLQNAVGRVPPDPARAREKKEATTVLHAVLDVLPEGQRKAFEARCVHGLTLGEAADRLGKTESNVRKQAARAMRRLREVLRSFGIESIDDVDGWDGQTDPA